MFDFIPAEFHLGLLLFVYMYYDSIGQWIIDNYATIFSSEKEAPIENDPVPILPTPTIEFDNLYKKELADVKIVKLTDEQLMEKVNSFVMEKTPMGFVIMSWCQEHNRFNYYSDRKDVPYRFLDTVARKLAKSFDCKCVYVDIEQEVETCKNQFEDIKQKLEDKKNEIKKEQKDNKNDVFASYKKYNNTQSEAIEKNDELLIKDKINLYKYMGMVRDFQFLNPPVKEVKQLTYADFIN